MIQMHLLFEYNGWRLWKYWWLKHKRKILIVFDVMIADIITNKKIEAIVKELFIRCRKLNISLVFITQSYFSVPKDVRGNSTYYLIMKINSKRELQNIVSNKSFCRYWLQRFCKDLQRMHKKPYSFLTINTILPASDLLRLGKTCFNLVKLTVTYQLEIIDAKIKANQAQYDLDRLAANIFAYSSGDLRKNEDLIGEDLEYKPSVVEQAKYDYSPLGKVFNKGLPEGHKKEGLLKRVKNIGDKNKELLKAFNAANKVCKAAKNENGYSYNPKYPFYRFYRDSEKFDRMVSLDSKHGELKEFNELLNNFKNHKPATVETKNRKSRIMNNVNQRYNKYFDTYKKDYNSEHLNEEDNFFLTLTSLKGLVRKNKNQICLKKILRERCKN